MSDVEKNTFPFKLDFLDHVAIRVKDITASAEWYEKVLGLAKYQLPEWGPYPIFMLSGKTGIAIFPAQSVNEPVAIDKRQQRIDHFAFQLSHTDFKVAQEHLRELGIDFKFQDHIYFHSIYIEDPDGHEVELTTLTIDPDTFYKKKV